MIQIIINTLTQLVGYRLTHTTRAANMECLKFGEHLIMDDEQEEINIGEFAIHLQCAWRIISTEKLLIGNSDVFEQPDENDKYDSNFDWVKLDGNMRDHKLKSLIKKEKLEVSSIEADKFGGFTIVFKNNFKLEVFPNSSLTNSFSEYWRILDNRPEKEKHIVLGGRGLYVNE